MPTAPSIRIRTEQLDLARRSAGLTTAHALAVRMGVHPSTVTRTLSGEAAPGTGFIAALLGVFPDLRFEDLFEADGMSASRAEVPS